ncbi:MAG: hypothetical protein ABFD89_23830 [Bryobacteraceae bacterium]
MFNKDTLKSKTFWGVIVLGAISAAHSMGVIPEPIFQMGVYVIATFTGVSAVDRSTKVLEATKGK